MSGLTLPAAVARGRHWNPTPNHAECLGVTKFGMIPYLGEGKASEIDCYNGIGLPGDHSVGITQLFWRTPL